MLFRQKTLVAVLLLGQAGGAVSNPRLQAAKHSSGAGVAQAGVTPVQGGGGGQVPHEMAACQPGLVMEKSEVKRNVRQPLLAVSVPGEFVPVYLPMSGKPVVGPL